MEKAKDNQKLRSEYLAMNLHDRDIKKQAYKDGLEEGIFQGAEQAKLETAKKLLGEGISIEVIARTTNLSVEILERFQKTCCK